MRDLMREKSKDQALLLAIHNQCEDTQRAIEINYSRECPEIRKELMHLLQLIEEYLAMDH